MIWGGLFDEPHPQSIQVSEEITRCPVVNVRPGGEKHVVLGP